MQIVLNQQIVLYHNGLKVKVNLDPAYKDAAVLLSWVGNPQAVALTRDEAEALCCLLDLGLDHTGPRALVPVDLTGPDAPVFLRRQAD